VEDDRVERRTEQRQRTTVALLKRQVRDARRQLARLRQQQRRRVAADNLADGRVGCELASDRTGAASNLEHVRAGGQRKIGEVRVQERALLRISGPRLHRLCELLRGRRVGLRDGRVDVGMRPLSPLRRQALQAYRRRMAVVRAAVARLPPVQHLVITLRDVDGWESREVCNALEISETNQGVLLHRARSRVRAELASYLSE
jgi:DNA-directed RNA polymerase specialized sigma24 family protein